MNKFQLWNRDEYGQGSILFTSDDIENVIKRAKEEITNINVNNSLTTDDRERNWEAYMPYIESKKKSENKKKMFIYGGKGPLNKDVYFSINRKNGGIKFLDKGDINNLEVKIYLGNVSASLKEEKDWFAKNNNLKIIDNISDPILSDKILFFIKVI